MLLSWKMVHMTIFPSGLTSIWYMNWCGLRVYEIWLLCIIRTMTDHCLDVILVRNNKHESCAYLFIKKMKEKLDYRWQMEVKWERTVHSVHTTQLLIRTIKHLVVLMMYVRCRCSSQVPYGHDLVSSRGSYSDEWHADLLGCCSEPALCTSINLIFELRKFD